MLCTQCATARRRWRPLGRTGDGFDGDGGHTLGEERTDEQRQQHGAGDRGQGQGLQLKAVERRPGCAQAVFQPRHAATVIQRE